MTTDLEKLEQSREDQVLGLGGLALEMHQQGEIDDSVLMERAAKVAEVEQEIEKLKEPPAQTESDDQKDESRSR
jgi:hypothetical protein